MSASDRIYVSFEQGGEGGGASSGWALLGLAVAADWEIHVLIRAGGSWGSRWLAILFFG